MITATEFSCYVPCNLLTKADSSGDAAPSFPRRIQGIASTERVDLQNETLLQRGIDIGYFKTDGWVSDEHDFVERDKSGAIVTRIPAANVGVPVADLCSVTKAGLWITADMIPPLDEKHSTDCRCPPCRSEWWLSFVKSLSKSGTGRLAGFSVDGKVQRRNGGTIVKSWISRVALTSNPVGRGTFADIAKSMDASPWCAVPGNADEPTCKCNACDLGAEATRKSHTDGLTFEQAVQHITGTRGWRPEVATAFAETLYRRHDTHAH